MSQIILNNTKLTFGHITSSLVVIGSILSAFGIYDKIIHKVGIGANLLIMSFGNTLTNYAYNGYISNGCLGLFSNMLSGVSLGIVATVVFSFIVTIFFNAKE